MCVELMMEGKWDYDTLKWWEVLRFLTCGKILYSKIKCKHETKKIDDTKIYVENLSTVSSVVIFSEYNNHRWNKLSKNKMVRENTLLSNKDGMHIWKERSNSMRTT